MRKIKINLTLLSICFLLSILMPFYVLAACSGSGLTWTCTAGSTAAQINSAISSASDGATITLANGTYSASGIIISPRNGVTVACATVRGCTMTASGAVFLGTDSTHHTNLMRISGFVFSNSTGGTYGTIDFTTSGNAWYDKLRIDNNTFNQSSNMSIAIGYTANPHYVYGVIDHNIFSASTHDYPLTLYGGSDWGGVHQGTANNLFIEDNTFNYTTENLGASGMDSFSQPMVVRYNTITNARISVHGVCHGAGGPPNLEVYSNTITGGSGSSSGYRLIHHQGSGEFMVFNNVLNPGTSDPISLLYYRSENPNPEGCGTCDGSQSKDGNRSGEHGYPCYHQPGRTGTGVLRPIYLWNNTQISGSMAQLSVDGSAGTYHILANRDYYQAVSTSAQTSATSPFSGTTGMGFGTLARRPTTCSTGSTDAADAGNGGVGYFATDTNTLYRCSASNTWTTHYQPYTYPHPLVGGESRLPAPSLRISQ
jgi:hypothetical protein